MKPIWWAVVIVGTVLGAYVMVQDAREGIRQAQAKAWYDRTQRESERSDSKQTWRAFKDCLQSGEKTRVCAEELE